MKSVLHRLLALSPIIKPMKNYYSLLFNQLHNFALADEIETVLLILLDKKPLNGKTLQIPMLPNQKRTLHTLLPRHTANERDFNDDIIDRGEYRRELAKIRRALTTTLKTIQAQIPLAQDISTTMQFPEADVLEKIIGTSQLQPIASLEKQMRWLQKGLQAAKSVCQVRIDGGRGGVGTGFLVEGGYLFTNHHVLSNPTTVGNSQIVFNYQKDMDGRALETTTYELDATDFKTSPTHVLDYARVRVKDPDDTLAQWGTLNMNTSNLPKESDPAIIIQHPQGRHKEIVTSGNDIVKVWDHRLIYRSDTEPGSSGSPVFNDHWEVIALHHAGSQYLPIDDDGGSIPANRGILFSHILKDIND